LVQHLTEPENAGYDVEGQFPYRSTVFIAMPSRSSYPLSSSSRARRRLAAMHSHAPAAEKPDLTRSQDDEPAPSTETPETEVAPATENDGGIPLLRTFDPLKDEHRVPDTHSKIRRLASRSRPATWVFCGDGPADAVFPDHFAAELRDTLRRPLDVVVNAMVPGGRIESLVNNLDWQIVRFHPDVVHVLIGPINSADGPEGRGRFVEHLDTLIGRLESLGAMVILHTPPVPDREEFAASTENAHFVDLPAYIEQVRGLSAEREIPLVDHFATGPTDNHDMMQRLRETLGI